MIKLIRKFFAPSKKDMYEDSTFYLVDQIVELKNKIIVLEQKLYHCEKRVDNIQPVIYNIHNKQKDT